MKRKIKLNNKKYILKIKNIIMFDDSELFKQQDYSNIPYLTEEEIDKMIEDLKNS